LILFFAIVVFLFIFSVAELHEPKVKSPLPVFIFFLILITFAGLKKIGLSRDDLNYVVAFESIKSIKDYFVNFSEWSFHEPLFHFSVVILKQIFGFNYHWYFFFFVTISVFLKFKVFITYGEYFYPLLMVYFSTFFLLHEMTQIRVSVACGLVLIGWFLYADNNKRLSFVFLSIAVLAHYSSIIAFLIYLFDKHRPTFKFYLIIILMIFIGLVFKFDSKSFIISLNISGISDKLLAYKTAEDSGLVSYDDSNVFNILFLARFILLGVFIYVNQLVSEDSHMHLFLKLFAFSIALYVFLSADPSVSIRISEMLGLSLIFLLVGSINLFEERLIVVSLIFFYCLGVLGVMLFIDRLFTTYKLFFQ
jgi:hypothetical protein